MRDRLVAGILDGSTRKELLTVKYLILEKAVDVRRASKKAIARLSKLKKDPFRDSKEEKINRIQGKYRRAQPQK